ncbi:cch1-calcium channel (alpha subunit) [Malassezia pachydermatis]|uniref:Calcium-channel protein CCH1 n=1 Tax=Malassezia pachydermatis TaxID=77020 RepID=A0A0M8MVY4_9BASI|nr:cch1-calcium channel (alpha subunit) [Malassezia pachydermatis]KOS15414.1 cch1-calcium channel (alpha subunit) [Malassezia pachydermatis]
MTPSEQTGRSSSLSAVEPPLWSRQDVEEEGEYSSAAPALDWASTRSSLLDETKSTEASMDDVFDTFHITPQRLEADDRRHANEPGSLWRQYLPMNEVDDRPQGEEVPPPDEENLAEEKESMPSLKEAFSQIKRATREMFERAVRRRNARRARFPDQIWLPMRENGAEAVGVNERMPVYASLRGKTLCYFGPDHPVRMYLARLLSSWWIEPTILAIIIMHLVVVTVMASRDVNYHPRSHRAMSEADEILLLVIFVLYTMEMMARVIVSGLLINPPPYDIASVKAGERPFTHEQSNTALRLWEMYDALCGAIYRFFRPYSKEAKEYAQIKLAKFQPTQGVGQARPEDFELIEPWWGTNRENAHWIQWIYYECIAVALHLSRTITGDPRQMAKRAYLRHSWNRVDTLAILCYWIALGLQISGVDRTPLHHIYIFRGLSVLRCSRLLGLWEGTETILRSLKRVSPLLLRVFFFIVFAMLLFAVIGIQSFKGSYLRQCVWIGDLNNEPQQNFTLSQLCGGSVDPNNQNNTIGYIGFQGSLQPHHDAKGYICPYGQLCMEQPMNPFNDVKSFDDVFHSLLQVSVVISLNGWSNTMYDMIDADYYTVIMFFIFGIIILNLWLANLFVAVISHSFASLSAQTARSAFAAEVMRERTNEQPEPLRKRRRRRRVVEWYRRTRRYTQYIWLALIIVSVAVQGSQASYEFPEQRAWRQRIERFLVIPFDLEIIIRWGFDWLDDGPGTFFRHKRNVLDMVIAIITTIIQIPVVRNSAWYPWLTFFQLLRFYRVIAAIPRMKSLLLRVVGSMSALFNMIAFLIMTIFLAALVTIQLFRGDVPPQDPDGNDAEFTWKQLFNGFLGVYQIFSSENWSSTLFNVVSGEKDWHQGVISAIFLVGWFIFANFILLQMFIAVINENFRVAEGDKYKRQMENYLRRTEVPTPSLLTRLMQRFSPFRVPHEQGTMPHRLEGPSTTDTMRYVDTSNLPMGEEKPLRSMFMQLVTPDQAGLVFGTLQRVLRLDKPQEHAELAALQTHALSQSKKTSTMNDIEELINEREGTNLLESNVRTMRVDLGLSNKDDENEFLDYYMNHASKDPRIRLAQMMAEHPSYDRSWFLFSNRNPIRRFCQSMTRCPHGERVFGRPMSKFRHYIFQTVVLGAIVASVVMAGIATPAYRKNFYAEHKVIYYSWFAIVEISLSAIFVAEFFVKTIADGFIFTPNAYLLNMWNLLDMFVLIFLLINVISELVVPGGVSHFTRAIKAFRALRLINLSSLMRDTFHAVIIAGAGHILDAAILALLYIIPYAVWGQNLFAGLLYACTDTSSSIVTKLDCHGEYSSSPLNWAFLAPRVWENPSEGSKYSFDDFKSALLILFEIVSLEGWIDVMTRAMSITGRDRQPDRDASQHNAVFFLIYNLIGAVSVLTLFVSVIIENFQRYSGAAFLTTEQRQWLDLKRQLQRQAASKRPQKPPSQPFKRWCFEAAIRKRGWWQRSMTLLYCIVLVLLMSQTNAETQGEDRGRSIAYSIIAVVFLFDIVIRCYGLGLHSFRRSYWNWYDIFVMAGTFATSISRAIYPSSSQVHAQLQKIFLTGVTLKLFQRSDALDLLFKTAVSSIPAIVALFLLWLTMFLVWGIMLVEVFGLTKWGPNETHAKNLGSLWRTLIFLSMTSTGEGWNSYMHDFAVQPPMCTPSSNYLETDCGSVSWAYFLFISWNIISMFIFLNMFTGTVVENFSYVYHLQGSTALSRDQMRLYKDTWSKFDPQGRGYIRQDQIVPFLAHLSGMFEVSLFPPDMRVHALMNVSRVHVPDMDEPSSPNSSRRHRLWPRSPRSPKTPRSAKVPPSPNSVSSRRSSGSTSAVEPSVADLGLLQGRTDLDVLPLSRVESGIDLEKLEAKLSRANWGELRMRRQRLNRMYQEAVLSDKGKGVSFSSMLFIIAYHKLCGSPTNMEVSEFIERRALMNKIDARIKLERVRGLLHSVYLRRRFLAARAGEPFTRVAVPSDDRGFPSITVERTATMHHPSTPSRHTRPVIHISTDINPFHMSDEEEGEGGSSHRGSMPSGEPVTPSRIYDHYTDTVDGVDVTSLHEVRLTPLSAQLSRSRTPVSSGSSDPPGVDTPTASPRYPSSLSDTWTQIMRRLSHDSRPDDDPHLL